MGDEPNAAGFESTLDEHRECMQVVAEVENCLDRQPDREGRWMGELQPRLESMTEMLRKHFREEEQAALYREVPERFPRFAVTLERLAGEHAKLLERAEGLLAKAKTLDHTRIHELREFNAGVQLLVARLRRHEAEENEVVLGAHWQEVGGEGD